MDLWLRIAFTVFIALPLVGVGLMGLWWRWDESELSRDNLERVKKQTGEIK